MDATTTLGNGKPEEKMVSEEKDKKPRAPAATGSNWTLAVVFLSLFVDLLGFTVILPLLPSLLDYYSKRDEVRTPQH